MGAGTVVRIGVTGHRTVDDPRMTAAAVDDVIERLAPRLAPPSSCCRPSPKAPIGWSPLGRAPAARASCMPSCRCQQPSTSPTSPTVASTAEFERLLAQAETVVVTGRRARRVPRVGVRAGGAGNRRRVRRAPRPLGRRRVTRAGRHRGDRRATRTAARSPSRSSRPGGASRREDPLGRHGAGGTCWRRCGRSCSCSEWAGSCSRRPTTTSAARRSTRCI